VSMRLCGEDLVFGKRFQGHGMGKS
jgi:hypothetical protein